MERYILREQEFYTGIPLPDGCEDMAAGEGYVLVVKAADAQAAVEALQAQLAQQGEEVQRWKGKYDVAQTNAQTWLNKYQDMVAWSDKQNGTPCEQIRHQQQVEALQRERDEVLEAASLPTWVCDGCGRVSSEGWINRVIDSFEGTDYEMECPVCGVRAIEEDCASDLVRERDDLQTALDAEREKVKGLHEVTKVICAHCCEPMEIPSKAVLQTQLTQLQALVRAYVEAKHELDDWFVRAGRDEHVPTMAEFDAIQKQFRTTEAAMIATLDATTPAKGQMNQQDVDEVVQEVMSHPKRTKLEERGDGE